MPLMISCTLFSSTLWIPMSNQFSKRKQRESRDITSGICIRPCCQPLRIHLMPWNTEFVENEMPLIRHNQKLSSKYISNWIYKELNSTLPKKKSKLPLTKQQLLCSDAQRNCSTGNNLRLIMTRKPVSMKWLHKTRKLLKLFSYWLGLFKEPRIKSTNCWLDSRNSNGCGPKMFKILLTNSQKRTLVYKIMKINWNVSPKLKRKSRKSPNHIWSVPSNLKLKIFANP